LRFHFDAYHLDVERRELLCHDAPVALEPQVFDLLLHLLRNRERVVSKDDLISHVWAGRIVSDATIDGRIRDARHAVGDDGAAQRVIRTVARKGVRFVASVREDTEPPPPAPNAPIVPALRGRPSIAVMAFDNISRDPADEAFADGVAEDIILALGRSSTLLVIARNSSFTFKGRTVDAKAIAEALGVRYLLTGSVRRVGARVRVGAQLIEADSGVQLWADRYDRPMTDSFAVQDEIADAVAGTILPTVAVAERQRALSRPAASLDAWQEYQRALGHWAAQESLAAEAALERAIALDPQFAPAHAVLADIYSSSADRGSRPYDEALDLAEAAARRAVALDPRNPDARAMFSRIHLMRDDPVAALRHAGDAVALGPNHAAAHMARGHLLVFMGRHDEGRLSLHTALRLNPMDPTIRVAEMLIGASLYLNREYAEAVSRLRALVLKFPRYSAANRWLGVSLAQCGRIEEAQATMAWLASFAPNNLTRVLARRPPSITQADWEHFVAGVRAAGSG
jgi:TolB-like protein/Tfp pilus assembly protein PilF